MARSGRIVCKVPVRVVADRRARRFAPTLPTPQTTFTAEELDIFRTLERRLHRDR